MKSVVKSLWIPVLVSVADVVAFLTLRFFPGVFIAIFQSDLLMYIWYELFLATIVGSTAVIIKTSSKIKEEYKNIYYFISFLIISNTYYAAGCYGFFVNLFYS